VLETRGVKTAMMQERAPSGPRRWLKDQSRRRLTRRLVTHAWLPNARRNFARTLRFWKHKRRGRRRL